MRLRYTVYATTAAIASITPIKTAAALSLQNRPPWSGPKTPSPLGDGVTPTTDDLTTHTFDPQTLKSSYKLLISTVTPRPIALVSTLSTDGVLNVAPFSYFGAMAHDPPLLSIGICRKGRDRLLKDSAKNIMDTGELCINIISEWYLDGANHSCGTFSPDVNEFDESGLEAVHDCQVVKCPRVKNAVVSYECKLWKCLPVEDDDGNPTTEIMICRVVRFHVREKVLVEGWDEGSPEVDTMKVKPVGRLGGDVYVGLGETVDIPRPTV